MFTFRPSSLLASAILLLAPGLGSRALAGNYSGTWETNWGPLTLVEDGKKVTGKYPQKKGKLTGAINKDGILEGTWTQVDDPKGGKFRLALSGDKLSFVGRWSHDGGRWEAETWDGQRKQLAVAAKPVSFAGKWKSTWDSGPLPLWLRQNGNTVVGGYDYKKGSMEGMVDGRVLTGTWSQSDGTRGTFRFTLSPDGQSFEGKWMEPDKRTAAWNGVRE